MEKSEEDKRRSDIAKSLGKNLLKFRKENGLTREELAEKSNLSANYIYGLENGTYLSNALNINISQLLDNYINNNRKNITDQLSLEISKLSDRDVQLILNILNFLNKK